MVDQDPELQQDHQTEVGEGEVVTEELPTEERKENIKSEENIRKDVDEEGLEEEAIKDLERDTVEGLEGEAVEGLEGEAVEGLEGEELIDEKTDKIEQKRRKKIINEFGEEVDGEEIEEEEVKEEEKQPEKPAEDEEAEEEAYVEEPPPDPAAPFDFSDSKEALKEPFELRQDQMAEIEQLWELYQNYTPAYTDIDGYITEKELIYMLNALMLMTYTPEQLQELIAYCVKPPDPNGKITFEQFTKMVTIRQRDFPIEEELRSALQVMDPDKTGTIDREYLKEVLSKQGHKMPQKQLDNLIKEVDISNDGTIGIEDVVGTMCIDLNKEDLMMLMASLNPPDEQPSPTDD